MFRNILVPIDLGVESSQRALPVAIEQARSSGGRITLLYALTPIPRGAIDYMPPDFNIQREREAKEGLESIISSNKIGAIAAAIVRHGTPYDEIIREAEDIEADLIVLVSHRPELSDYLIGSNAARVVRHAKCSVIVLR